MPVRGRINGRGITRSAQVPAEDRGYPLIRRSFPCAAGGAAPLDQSAAIILLADVNSAFAPKEHSSLTRASPVSIVLSIDRPASMAATVGIGSVREKDFVS